MGFSGVLLERFRGAHSELLFRGIYTDAMVSSRYINTITTIFIHVFVLKISSHVLMTPIVDSTHVLTGEGL